MATLTLHWLCRSYSLPRSDAKTIRESFSAAASKCAAFKSRKASVFLIIGSARPYLHIIQWNGFYTSFIRWRKYGSGEEIMWESLGCHTSSNYKFIEKVLLFLNKQWVCRFTEWHSVYVSSPLSNLWICLLSRCLLSSSSEANGSLSFPGSAPKMFSCRDLVRSALSCSLRLPLGLSTLFIPGPLRPQTAKWVELWPVMWSGLSVMGERPESVELTTLLTIKRQPDTASSSSHCSQRPPLPPRSDSKASQQMRQPVGQTGSKATISLRVMNCWNWVLYVLVIFFW